MLRLVARGLVAALAIAVVTGCGNHAQSRAIAVRHLLRAAENFSSSGGEIQFTSLERIQTGGLTTADREAVARTNAYMVFCGTATLGGQEHNLNVVVRAVATGRQATFAIHGQSVVLADRSGGGTQTLPSAAVPEVLQPIELRTIVPRTAEVAAIAKGGKLIIGTLDSSFVQLATGAKMTAGSFELALGRNDDARRLRVHVTFERLMSLPDGEREVVLSEEFTQIYTSQGARPVAGALSNPDEIVRLFTNA